MSTHGTTDGTDFGLAPRRLRAQDVIDAQQRTIEQLTTRSGEPYVTVEHTLNAKGDTQTSVKVSAPMGHDALALARYASDVEVIAATLYEKATSRYPRTPADPAVEAAKADKAKTGAIAANVARHPRTNGETK